MWRRPQTKRARGKIRLTVVKFIRRRPAESVLGVVLTPLAIHSGRFLPRVKSKKGKVSQAMGLEIKVTGMTTKVNRE